MIGRFRQFAVTLAVAGLAWAPFAAAQDRAAAKEPVPIRFENEKILGYAVIPNLDELLKHIEAIQAQIQPDPKRQKGMIKMLLGMQLGDFGLANLIADKPIVVVVIAPDQPGRPPHVVGLLSVRNATTYHARMKQLNMTTRFGNGLLAIAETDAAIDAAADVVAGYGRFADAGLKTDVRVYVHADRLLKAYAPLIEAGLLAAGQQIAKTPALPGLAGFNGARLATLFKASSRGGMALLQQVEEYQLDLTLSKNTLRLASYLKPKPGTALSGLFENDPPKGTGRCLSVLAEAGVAAGMYRIDAAGLSALFTSIVKPVRQDPELKDLLPAEMVKLFTEFDSWWTGEGAFATRPAKQGGGGHNDSVVRIRDRKRMQEMIRASLGLLDEGTLLGDLMQAAGVKMSVELQQNVRAHNGVPVHRMHIEADLKNANPLQAQQIKQSLRDQEFAYVGDYVVQSTEPAMVNTLIDRAANGDKKIAVTLESYVAYGDRQNVYTDMDLIGAIVMSNPMLGVLLGGANVKREPVTVGASLAKGRGLVRVEIPLAPFINMVRIMSGLGNQAPPPPGGDDFEF